MADVTLSSIAGQPRRQIFTLTESNAALAIPSWAQGGKGLVYVTGVGGGASGGVNNGGIYGGGGAAGAYAIRHPLIIPSGQTSCNVVIGAGGAAVTTTGFSNGNRGSDTGITIGTARLTLRGGEGGYGGGSGGRGGTPDTGPTGLGWIFDEVAAAGGPWAGHRSVVSGGPHGITLSIGAGGQEGNTGSRPGSGGHSPWGNGGAGSNQYPNPANGGNATGYGAGGAGTGTNGTSVTTGAGTPGLLIIEFVEGF